MLLVDDDQPQPTRRREDGRPDPDDDLDLARASGPALAVIEARAHEVAAYVSSAPGPGGAPIYEWIEVRPVMTAPATIE